jgi:hypothetical protein
VAQHALPSGALRRRVVFGLLDADGWTWATLRALFWFLFVVFMLGYIPNLAYFFTVSNTVKVGYNFASIVNWCPAANEDLPCPVSPGTLLPWQTSPAELILPSARDDSVLFQSGTELYLIGGRTAEGATDEVLVTQATTTDDEPNGNLSGWQPGPALPEPRAAAALGVFGGVPYVIGGVDASGAATDTVFRGVVEEGLLTAWELAGGDGAPQALTLPRPISDAVVVPGTAGFALLGGRGADGRPVDDVYVAWIPEDQDPPDNTLQPWQPLAGLPLPEPRAEAVAGAIGDFIYVVGGEGPDGPTDSIFRLELSGRQPAAGETGEPLGWAVAQDQLLPEVRADATGYVANGSLYVIGGSDAEGRPQESVFWVVPDAATGDITGGWQRLEQTDLPGPLSAAPMAGVASTAFLFGGTDEEGLSDGLMRAGLSPQAPFYQLGLFGATLPGLAIKGEVGQQLGYLAAMGAGMTNFAVLVLIGLAYSHQATTKRLISRLSGGRLKVLPDEEYQP